MTTLPSIYIDNIQINNAGFTLDPLTIIMDQVGGHYLIHRVYPDETEPDNWLRPQNTAQRRLLFISGAGMMSRSNIIDYFRILDI